MPPGIPRFMGAVIPLAVLMPLVPALAQEPGPRPQLTHLTISEAEGAFSIRAARRPEGPPASLRLGKTIRIDGALVRGGRIHTTATKMTPQAGGSHETR